MARRLLVSLCCLAVMVATLATPQLHAQSNSGLKLVTELTMPGSNASKWPHVAAGRGNVFVSTNVNENDAVYWVKADNALSFGSYFIVGDAGGQPDYSTTSVMMAQDGQVYYAWDDAPSRTIYMRTIDAAGNQGPQRVVNSGSPFPIAVEVAVSTKNQIFVAWRDPEQPISYRYSENGGVSWSARGRASNYNAYASAIDLAAGPSGQMAITFTAGDGDKLQIFTGIWDDNAKSFIISRVSPAGVDYADSSVTYTPDGTLYTAWRGVLETGSASGVFYAERQPDGSWPISRIVDGKINSTVNLDADEQGNLHLAWIAQPSGGNQLYYAFKPATDTFRGPIASANTGSIFNAHADASAGANGTFDHVALEWFSGSKLVTRYALFQAEGALYGATPLIEGGAAVVGGKTSVQVAFTKTTGVNPTTTQVRWRWNAPPTDTAYDSSGANGWTPYASTMSVPIPPALLNSTSCAASTLYTQLRDTSRGLLEDPPAKASILVDYVVQSIVDVHNPFIEVADGLSSTQSLSDDLALSKGAAAAGDPSYTRVPLIYLSVASTGDCTGITSVGVGASASAIEATYKTDSNGFSGMIPLPDLANLETGTRPVAVQVRDGAGNVLNKTFNIVFDDVPPVLSNAPTMTQSDSSSIVQNLTFTNVQVTDNLYTTPNEAGGGSRQFWGVWLANTTDSTITPAQAVDALKWKAVPVTATAAGTYVVKNWSLATGLSAPPASGTTTTYYVFVRYLDGAGNATTAAPIRYTVTSDSNWAPSYMPLLRR